MPDLRRFLRIAGWALWILIAFAVFSATIIRN
jgi:hypothetical protein